MRQEITTVAELDALPIGSVVLWRVDHGSLVARKPHRALFPRAVGGFWEVVGSELGTDSSSIAEDAIGPIAVLLDPLDQPCHADVLLELANQEPTS